MRKLGGINVIRELVITDFKLKYKSPIFGYMWSVLSPLMLLITLYIVFSLIIKFDTPHFQLFLLIGIIIWNFFNDAASLSLNSMQEKSNLIKQLNFSPLTYIISAIITSLLSLLINLIIFILMMVIFNLKFNLISILYWLLYLSFLIIFAFGISMTITGVYPVFKDIKHLWGIITLIWFWMTPIFYSEQLVSKYARKFYMLNPMARIINHSRDIFIYNFIPDISQTLITLIICLTFLFIGFLVYRSNFNKFDEEL